MLDSFPRDSETYNIFATNSFSYQMFRRKLLWDTCLHTTHKTTPLESNRSFECKATFTYKYPSTAFFMSKNQVSVVYVFLTSYEMNQTHKNRSVQCTPTYSSPSFNNFQNFAMLVSYSPTPFHWCTLKQTQMLCYFIDL